MSAYRTKGSFGDLSLASGFEHRGVGRELRRSCVGGRSLSAEPYVLEPATIGAYLRGRGVLPDGCAEVRTLAGGVSNDVLLVSAAGTSVVVKQALARLRVDEEWLASRARIGVEAAALELAGSLCPDAVPAVLAIVPEDYLLVMDMAPQGLEPWKEQLLRGQIDKGVAERVGNLIGTWHEATSRDPAATERFRDKRALIELRIDPFYATIAKRYPELSGRIGDLAGALLGASCCLVHGDLSPKNVMTDGTRTWVIDWEVATLGDPVFDLAFMICHLRCKAEARPGDARRYEACATAFLEAYEKAAGEIAGGIDEGALVAHTACLLLARVDGKSPVGYLQAGPVERIRRLGRALLANAPFGLEQIWAA